MLRKSQHGYETSQKLVKAADTGSPLALEPLIPDHSNTLYNVLPECHAWKKRLEPSPSSQMFCLFLIIPHFLVVRLFPSDVFSFVVSMFFSFTVTAGAGGCSSHQCSSRDKLEILFYI